MSLKETVSFCRGKQTQHRGLRSDSEFDAKSFGCRGGTATSPASSAHLAKLMGLIRGMQILKLESPIMTASSQALIWRPESQLSCASRQHHSLKALKSVMISNQCL